MICPHCNSADGTSVIETRFNENSNTRRRRHECLACKKRFSTYESVFVEPKNRFTPKADEIIQWLKEANLIQVREAWKVCNSR